MFHLRHSEDGANFNIFTLSLSFSHQLLYKFNTFKNYRHYPINFIIFFIYLRQNKINVTYNIATLLYIYI